MLFMSVIVVILLRKQTELGEYSKYSLKVQHQAEHSDYEYTDFVE